MPTRNMIRITLLGCMLTACLSAFAAPGDLRPLHLAEFHDTGPVIEYTQEHSLLPAAPEPMLRVYGNGRVRVHFPAHMKRAGDYEMFLNPQQMSELLRELADFGMMEFDSFAARHERDQLEDSRREATGEVFHISDDTITQIRIRLGRFQRSNNAPLVRNLNRHIRLTNPRVHARRFPQSVRLQNAAAAVARLDALCHHPALRKLP